MVGQKVDGIAIVVPDQQIGPQVIDMAAQAKIPLVSADDPIKSGTGEAAASVGFDGFDMGSKVGEEAGKLFKASGWSLDDVRVIAAYQQQLSVCQDRESGEEAAFQKVVGGLPKIIKVGTDNSTVDAQNKTGAVVTANPNVKHWVAWACNDENLMRGDHGARQRRRARSERDRGRAGRLDHMQGLAGRPDDRKQGRALHQRSRRRRRRSARARCGDPRPQASSRQDDRSHDHRRARKLEVGDGELQLAGEEHGAARAAAPRDTHAQEFRYAAGRAGHGRR